MAQLDCTACAECPISAEEPIGVAIRPAAPGQCCLSRQCQGRDEEQVRGEQGQAVAGAWPATRGPQVTFNHGFFITVCAICLLACLLSSLKFILLTGGRSKEVPVPTSQGLLTTQYLLDCHPRLRLLHRGIPHATGMHHLATNVV